MGAAVKWGVILALAVTVFNAIWVLAGLHTSLPAAAGYIAVVTILDIVAVVIALKATASENSYGKQLLGGIVLGVAGGALIFLTSWLMMTFLFPNVIPEQIAGFTAAYESLPLPEEQRQQAIDALQGVTALNSSFQGAMGALVTSIVVGAIAGIFLRRRSPAAA